MNTLVARGLELYAARKRRLGYPSLTMPEPAPSACAVEKVNGTSYVVLRNNYKIIHVFRLRRNGRLMSVAQVPAGLDI
jgi:hypothetical protein